VFVPTPKKSSAISDTDPTRPFLTPAGQRTRLPLLLDNEVLVSLNDPALAAKIVSFLITTFPNAERDEPKQKKQKI
jgi:hypothetical protein